MIPSLAYNGLDLTALADGEPPQSAARPRAGVLRYRFVSGHADFRPLDHEMVWVEEGYERELRREEPDVYVADGAPRVRLVDASEVDP